MEGFFKNINDGICSSLHTDLIKCITDLQVHTTNNTRIVMNELINQEVKTDNIQYYNIYQELILLNLVAESGIYNNYSYASCVDLESEKTPDSQPKKLEFNIDKSEIDLKKIDFNINISDNEIDDINDKETVHSSDDLTDDDYSNIEDHENQHK